MIQQNLQGIRDELGKTTLVAVSKYRTIEELMALYNAGQRIFAENRVQEILRKKPELPNDVEWHLIGHLQTNKVKQIINQVRLIHSADRTSVLDEIEKQSKKQNVITSVLLQLHVAKEDSKHGFTPEELESLVASGGLTAYEHITFKGVMSMATFTTDTSIISAEFERTTSTFYKLKSLVPDPDVFTEISMGMSGDYLLAIEHGATMVRIGSKLFE